MPLFVPEWLDDVVRDCANARAATNNPIEPIFRQIAHELRADAVVLGIDLGHGYRHVEHRETESLPDVLPTFGHPPAKGLSFASGPLTCGLARRRETPRSRIDLLRAANRPDFDCASRKHLESILPFVDRAISLACEIESSRLQATRAKALLEESQTACLLLAVDGEVLEATEAARALLDDLGGSCDGKLLMPDEPGQRRLAYLLRQLSHPASAPSVSLNIGQTMMLVLTRSATVPGLIAASIPPSPAAPSALQPDVACRYRLTPSELRLCQALVEGRSLKQCACRWNRSYETLRGQLKTVFSKTGCHRQGELIALLRLPDKR